MVLSVIVRYNFSFVFYLITLACNTFIIKLFCCILHSVIVFVLHSFLLIKLHTSTTFLLSQALAQLKLHYTGQLNRLRTGIGSFYSLLFLHKQSNASCQCDIRMRDIRADGKKCHPLYKLRTGRLRNLDESIIYTGLHLI